MNLSQKLWRQPALALIIATGLMAGCGTKTEAPATTNTTVETAPASMTVGDVNLSKSNVAGGETTDDFKPTDPAVYCMVNTSGTPAGTALTANLMYKENGADKQVTSVTNTTVAGGTGMTTFDFTAPTNGWPKGDYRIDIMANGAKVADKDFEVKD